MFPEVLLGVLAAPPTSDMLLPASLVFPEAPTPWSQIQFTEILHKGEFISVVG